MSLISESCHNDYAKGFAEDRYRSRISRSRRREEEVHQVTQAPEGTDCPPGSNEQARAHSLVRDEKRLHSPDPIPRLWQRADKQPTHFSAL